MVRWAHEPFQARLLGLGHAAQPPPPVSSLLSVKQSQYHLSGLRAALCVFSRYIVPFCVLHCYMFYEFFCNFLFSLLMIILQGISAIGSFTVVLWSYKPRQGQRMEP